MVTSVQLTFPLPVKQCLNITRELKTLNVFRHIDTTLMTHFSVFFSRLETGTSNVVV